MKKLVFTVFVGIFCLGATNTFAQAKKETTQEKMIRLEVENKVLNERVTALTQEIVSLQSQLAAAKAQQPKATAIHAQTQSAVKPYYANLELQQFCEQYPVAKRKLEQYNKDKGGRLHITKAWVTEREEPNWKRAIFHYDYKKMTVFHARGWVGHPSNTYWLRLIVAFDGKLKK